MQVDPRHFAQAVTQLGERRTVVAHSAIFNTQGLKVLDKGVAIDAKLYERLSRHQLRVPLAECVDCEPTVAPASLREDAMAMLANEPVLWAMLLDGRERDILLTEVSLIPLPRAVAFQLALAKDAHPELWTHSLRAMLLAGWLALRGGAARHDVRMLAAGGLVHDLGMLHIDPVLLQPELALTRDQRRQLYTHPLVAGMLLERHHDYPAELVRAVLEHHERVDGSGYPRALRGDALSPWGCVLSLAEVAAAMLAPERAAGVQRLSLILRVNRGRFDGELVRELMQKLPAPADAPPLPDGDALRTLQDVGALLGTFGEDRGDGPSIDAARRERWPAMLAACEQARRALARAGASPEHLDALAGDPPDAQLSQELQLLAGEAAWQLRSVSRRIRRLWSLQPEEAAPDWLQSWLDACDRCAEAALGTATGAEGRSAQPPA